MNVVCTGDGRFVEVQGTAEAEPFDRKELDALLDLAVAGCVDLAALQREALEPAERVATHQERVKKQPRTHATASLRVRAHGSNRAPVRVPIPGEGPHHGRRAASRNAVALATAAAVALDR